MFLKKKKKKKKQNQKRLLSPQELILHWRTHKRWAMVAFHLRPGSGFLTLIVPYQLPKFL